MGIHIDYYRLINRARSTSFPSLSSHISFICHPSYWRHLRCFSPVPTLRLDDSVVRFIVSTEEKGTEAQQYCDAHNQRLAGMLPSDPGEQFGQRLDTGSTVSRAVLEPLKFLAAKDRASAAMANKGWYAASWSTELWADCPQC